MSDAKQFMGYDVTKDANGDYTMNNQNWHKFMAERGFDDKFRKRQNEMRAEVCDAAAEFLADDVIDKKGPVKLKLGQGDWCHTVTLNGKQENRIPGSDEKSISYGNLGLHIKQKLPKAIKESEKLVKVRKKIEGAW